jgi:hypothetical protein
MNFSIRKQQTRSSLENKTEESIDGCSEQAATAAVRSTPVRRPKRAVAELDDAAAAPPSAIRRLSDANVRAIFECLYNGTPPPPELPFVIVPVGPTGEKLSPPSFEFEGKQRDRNNRACLAACQWHCCVSPRLLIPLVFLTSGMRLLQMAYTFCCVPIRNQATKRRMKSWNPLKLRTI